MSTGVADFAFKKQSKFCVACPNNSRGNPELSSFRIPKDDARCAIWKAILRVDKLNKLTSEECYSRFCICSKHFGSDMFSNSQKNRLKNEAIPTGSIEGIHSTEQDTSMVENTEQSQLSENIAGTSRGIQHNSK